MKSRHSELLMAASRGALILALFWITGFALVQFGQRVVGGWAASQVGEVLACSLGVLLAFRLRVKFISYVLAGQLAFSLQSWHCTPFMGTGRCRAVPRTSRSCSPAFVVLFLAGSSDHEARDGRYSRNRQAVRLRNHLPAT